MPKHRKNKNGIEAFGKHLQSLRKKLGVSQEALAMRADVEISQISRIERACINTSLSQLLSIAKALDIHPKELLDFHWDSSTIE
ncbi:MAG: helix-turn-helix transcriptional regulator [Saprospiraceae bacterium]|jgi:transcriptional regulator with XRE-family HTH domain|nr:helix-turn-helix transcriptional regulator [Saprospiraceae bacterium]MBL0191126.1 helix-turn-helix transcriptional regulator [Saprospiraceae bacterium]MBL0294843.1 helix-turn-helix transcriptional regulator [Saprospiraceae bacterium]